MIRMKKISMMKLEKKPGRNVGKSAKNVNRSAGKSVENTGKKGETTGLILRKVPRNKSNTNHLLPKSILKLLSYLNIDTHSLKNTENISKRTN